MDKNIIKISAFGGSVTQQLPGYVSELGKLLDIDVGKYGYGGTSIATAGIVYIDTVLDDFPDLCIIQWLSRIFIDEPEKLKLYIDTIVYKFTNANCKLLFLILPNQCENDWVLDKYKYVKKYLSNNNVSYLDIRQHVSKEDYSIYLRDDVHTTIEGAKKYAEVIYNFLHKNEIGMPNNIFDRKYTNINKIVIEKDIKNEIELFGNGEIIAFKIKKNQHSGILDVFENDKFIAEYNFWDRWCHYERYSCEYKYALNDTNLKLKITNKVFDTSQCKESIDFTAFEKKIYIYEIYYIGNLIVLNVE